MKRFGRFGFLLVLLSVAGCDHVTKWAAQAELSARAPVALVPGVVDLRYAPNTDTAFSLLGGYVNEHIRLVVLLALSALATLAVAVAVMRRFKESTRLERVGGAAVLGGALGNVTDRALRGHVIDFIHVHHWPVFNVADVAICVGVALLAIAWGRSRRPAVP